MAEGCSKSSPLLRGLPDEIVVWEILARLAPKALLRCRAVCPAWRRATSTRCFLLAYHGRQPTLLLLCGFNHLGDIDDRSVGITPLDHRAGLTTADQLQSVARVGPVYWFFRVEASCDGLLVLSINCMGLCIGNPAIRQYAPLPLLYGIQPSGMYLHPPTSEYRLLLNSRHLNLQDGYYVQAPMKGTVSVLSGSLHWWMGQLIMVFNTTAETFRQMHSPIASGRADLFEMDDMLFMYRFNNVAAEVDIWVLEDYQSEVWTCKHRTELTHRVVPLDPKGLYHKSIYQ